MATWRIRLASTSSETENLFGKRGTRWHLVPPIFIVSPASSANSCMTSAENVGQDGILSHEISSFQGEFRELVYDSSEVKSEPKIGRSVKPRDHTLAGFRTCEQSPSH